MKVVAYLDEMNEEQFLTLRKEGIGASEIAGVMGYSPWQTPLSIYVNKVEGIDSREESIAMEVGLELEPFIQRKFFQWLKKNEGIEGVEFDRKTILASDEYPFIRCSPDAIFNHPIKGMSGGEYKTVGEYMKGAFGDQEVPDHYFLQCQQAMYITGYSEWYLAYLVGNRKFEVIIIPRSEETINSIVESAKSFWNNHILTEIPPAPTDSGIDTIALRAIYPFGEGTVELFHLEDQYELLKQYEAENKELAEKIQGIKNNIMAEMKDSEVAVFGTKDSGKMKRAVWKKTEDAEVKAYVRKGSRVFRTY